MSKERLWIAAAVIVAGYILLRIAIMIVAMVGFHSDYSTAREQFPRRHVEATAAIERTYAHFERFGKWPNQEELDTICRESLTSDWSCWGYQDEQAPAIILNGPHHFAIIYYFEPPEEEAISREWTFSNEGSKSTFQSTVSYSVENASEPEGSSGEAADSLQ